MHTIRFQELAAVAGGESESSDYPNVAMDGSSSNNVGVEGGPMAVVKVTATSADAAAARSDFASATLAANFITASSGIAAGGITSGACMLGPALLSGPAAAETLAVISKPCYYLGGIVGTAVGVYVGSLVKPQ